MEVKAAAGLFPRGEAGAINGVYGNGTSVLEKAGRLYFVSYQKGDQSLSCYDMRTGKNKSLVGKMDGYVDNLWMGGGYLYYQGNKGICRVLAEGGKEELFYKGSKTAEILYVDEGAKTLYAVEQRPHQPPVYREIGFDGKEKKLCRYKFPRGTDSYLECAAFTDWYQGEDYGTYFVFRDDEDIYWNRMGAGDLTPRACKGAVKRLKRAQEKKGENGSEFIRMLGVYGSYLYGYVCSKPGTIGWLQGNLWKMSMRTGKVEIVKNSDSFWNSCQMEDGRIYAVDWSPEGDGGGTRCFILDRKGGVSLRHPDYSAGFDVLDGKYFYGGSSEGVFRYEMETEAECLLDSDYAQKEGWYYYNPNSASNAMELLNGKLFYQVYDCRKESYVGWRLMPDRILCFYLPLDREGAEPVCYRIDEYL